MDKTQKLCQELLEDSVAIETLTDQELIDVLQYFHIAAESMQMDLDPDRVAAAEAMIAILQEFVDLDEPDEFAEAIDAAEARGSTYWEFENPSIH
jgi:hypothetical protein